MNERIRKLALEADKDVGENVSFEFCERFAQLIVKECASIVDNQGRWILYDKLAVKIKKHFGVEE
jgi:hypothetical protein